jgi:hypothetical protein
MILDQGKEFCNELVNRLCALWDVVDKRRTSLYHPQTNSSAESYNRSMRKYITAIFLLAVAQVAATVQIDFDEVERVPMARFHRVGEVFPEALYGHIIVTLDVAVLRGQMKDLQEGISYRPERATPKHRDVYNVLEENLVAGNQELESDMTFFATAERKERTFGEWIAGVLGLWNVVEIHSGQEDG